MHNFKPPPLGAVIDWKNVVLKILTILGTRPEAIKLAPVIKKLQKHPTKISCKLCVTAQHRHLLDQVLKLFDMKVDYDLDLMRPEQSLSQVASNVLSGLEPILKKEQPDWVLVQGDTTSIAAASIASYYAQCKIGHIEAGLRTFNKYQPFPEEINRRIASVIADMHFAPTERAKENLLREGISEDKVYLTGNTVIDALHIVLDMPYDPFDGPLTNLPWDKRLILVTTHRRENFGKPLEDICSALITISQRYLNNVHIIIPVHPNPAVKNTIHKILEGIEGITLTEPLEYIHLVNLMKKSTIILTDSGGIQEEAPGMGKPVLVMRETTERPEGVETGNVKLVGTNKDRIVCNVDELLNNSSTYNEMTQLSNPYGDGLAADRIVEALLKCGIQ
ncbi:MAG: UDP-N-acetylglucosamine 2-epimerase (non-hydrolyzing) [Anaerolineae bacterium]|nr:MAG: UDP-N-acetylglucosamine 2-epimerase (non-hydrolyzing) [Anaerolineae bacterium]